MSNDSNSLQNNRRAKWRLRAASVSVLILGVALLFYGIFLALTAVVAAFSLIAMGLIILGVAFSAEFTARKLEESPKESRH